MLTGKKAICLALGLVMGVSLVVSANTELKQHQPETHCAGCITVAQTIVNIRDNVCHQKMNVTAVMAVDPMYRYMNGLGQSLGYNSPLFTSVVQIIEANVNCENTNDWIERSIKTLTDTFNVKSSNLT